jgi:cell division protein FtsB
MKRIAILIPVFIGSCIYSLLSISVGPKGIWAMNQLINEEIRINKNLDELNEININLNEQVANLSANIDTITIYAHELGYISEGERLIKLAGFSGGISRFYRPGSAVAIKRPEFIPDWTCKLISFLCALCSLFLYLVIFYRKNNERDSYKTRNVLKKQP